MRKIPHKVKPFVNDTETLQTERVSIDINTDVTEIVEKVADSVVGVTNLQRVRDIWSSSEMTKETGTVLELFIRNKAIKHISLQIITSLKVQRNLKLRLMMEQKQKDV